LLTDRDEEIRKQKVARMWDQTKKIKRKRPAKHTVDNYDFGLNDNNISDTDPPKPCTRKIVECIKCLKLRGKRHLGHITETLFTDDYIYSQDHEWLLARVVIYHGHFALIKNTKTPAPDTGRNTCCDVDAVWLNINRDLYASYKKKRKGRKPDFTKSDE
jgi:hypothetical protein